MKVPLSSYPYNIRELVDSHYFIPKLYRREIVAAQLILFYRGKNLHVLALSPIEEQTIVV